MAGRKKETPTNETGLQPIGATAPEIASRELALHSEGKVITREQAQIWVEAGIQTGQLRAAIVSATVSDRIIAESYAKIVETRAYAGMPYVDPDGTRGNVSSLDEFCERFLGKGARRCRQIASNLSLLGEELYEAGQRIGLGQRDYNALKALPSDAQAAVKQALANGGDKRDVVGLIVDLLDREMKEKAEREATITTLRERGEKKERENERLHQQNRKLRGDLAKATPDQVTDRLRTQLQVAAMEVRAAVVSSGEEIISVSRAVDALMEHGNETDQDFKDYIGGVLNELIHAIRGVRDAWSLPVLDSYDLPWLDKKK